MSLPTVTGISPNSGSTSGRRIVIITGTNFTDVTNVDFGATPASSFIVNDATTITATSPAGAAGTVDVMVTTPIATSAISVDDQFTYTGYIPCFKKGSKILTDNGYKVVEQLKKGDRVKTLLNGYKPIVLIGKREIYHPASIKRNKDQLYNYSAGKIDELFEDLVLTGCHSVLVDCFSSEEQNQQVRDVLGRVFITDKKIRLPACVDPRATVYLEEGTYTIYHIALEHDNYFMNYGIYANGLLVESCSQRFLKEFSNMELIDEETETCINAD
jgi:hypothetical protein